MAQILHRLSDIYRRHPLLCISLVGLALRSIAALWAIGFFARDDYFHVLDISLAWIDDPEFNWETSGRAGAGIRSHLLPRLVQGMVLAARALGIHSPTGTLQLIGLVLGAYATLAVPATWFLMREHSARARHLATWMVAAHFVLPYAGTRLLIEAAAIPPLLWGLAFAQRNQTARDALYAGFLIGLACWWRYQVGVVGLAVAAVLFWTSQAKLRQVGMLALGAFAALVLQGGFDLATFGEFLGPVRGNITANLTP
ncbi:MAG: hypothetical protein AAFQ82_10890, partial [Myxococcota bacterium]